MRAFHLLAVLMCCLPAGAVVATVSDSDNDGMPDELDLCPYSPAGAWIDADGCAQDTDRDGVADGIDRCVATPQDLRADESGCAAVQVAADQPHAPLPADPGAVQTLDDLPEMSNEDLVSRAMPSAVDEAAVEPEALPAPPTPTRPPVLDPAIVDARQRSSTAPVETAAPASESPTTTVAAGAAKKPKLEPDTLAPEPMASTAAIEPEPGQGDAKDEISESAPAPAVESEPELAATAPEPPTQALFFAAAQSDLDPRLVSDLQRWLAVVSPLLDANPRLQLAVSGHADITHDGLGATGIAARRAQAVRSRLLASGLPAHRIRLRVAGVVEPRYQGAALARNSRVELALIEAPVQNAAAARSGAGLQNVAPAPGPVRVAMYRVPFARHSTFIDPAARSGLDASLQGLLVSLRQAPRARLQVRGYALAGESNLGVPQLADDRAQAIRAYLIGRGIGAQRIDAAGSATPRGAFVELSVAPG